MSSLCFETDDDSHYATRGLCSEKDAPPQKTILHSAHVKVYQSSSDKFFYAFMLEVWEHTHNFGKDDIGLASEEGVIIYGLGG